jgi:hypothetical protein
MGNKQCAHLKGDGTRCKTFAVNGSEFCFSHDPGSREKKALAVRKGGEARWVEWCLDPVKIEEARDIKKLLATLINEVRQGDIPPQAASCIGYLSGVYLKAGEIGDLEERLTRIERFMEAQGAKQ